MSGDHSLKFLVGDWLRYLYILLRGRRSALTLRSGRGGSGGGGIVRGRARRLRDAVPGSRLRVNLVDRRAGRHRRNALQRVVRRVGHAVHFGRPVDDIGDGSRRQRRQRRRRLRGGTRRERLIGVHGAPVAGVRGLVRYVAVGVVQTRVRLRRAYDARRLLGRSYNAVRLGKRYLPLDHQPHESLQAGEQSHRLLVLRSSHIHSVNLRVTKTTQTKNALTVLITHPQEIRRILIKIYLQTLLCLQLVICRPSARLHRP